MTAGSAALAMGLFSGTVLAQAPLARKLKIDAYSRHLLWLKTPEEVAEACIEMGFDGLDITVRSSGGHVDPASVKTDLSKFVNVVRGKGLVVDTVTTNISDADSPYAEDILDAASQLGIKHYWWGTYRYDLTKPIMPQIEALKPRVAKLAGLNEKYGMKAMYHNYSGPGTVGNMIFDLLQVLQQFDPRWVSFHYDTGHAAEAGANGTWELGMRAAGPYIGGISFKDYLLKPDTPADERNAARDTHPESAPGNGPPNPWRSYAVPLGLGMVNLPKVAQVMKDINFSGPVEIQAEYPNGGADAGRDAITLPREQVLNAMKRDLLTLRAVLGPAGLI